MSDHSISIVPKKSSYPEKKNKSEEIIGWLISQDIIKPTISDCILGKDGGYAISDGARLVSKYPDDLPFHITSNGLEIVLDRKIYDNGEYDPPDIFCPNCKEEIDIEDLDIGPWVDKLSNNLICPNCKHETEINNFNFEPNMGFSELGFSFWNWTPFKDDFIEEFKNRLNCDASIIFCRI